MTGFAGFLVRDSAGLKHAMLVQIKARIQENLSRNVRHRVVVHDDERLFLAHYDNGAWQADRSIMEDEASVAVVSGDPLVPREDGLPYEPVESARHVADALATGMYAALAGAAGCFAALHWNPQTGILKLCADKLAHRPIYVRLTPSLCLFSTTLRVLRMMSDEPLRLSDAGIAEFVFLGDCLADRTIFEDVRLVLPGTVLEIGPALARPVNYYCWDAIPACSDDENMIIGRIHEHFMRAVRRRVRGRRNADAFLTGGMDSRSVVAGLIDSGVAVRGFNYSYPGSADDVLGRLLADRFGISLTVQASKPEDRVKLDTDLFALNARDHFPASPDAHAGARLIWSGDGGSVGLGHVYMTTDTVTAAAGGCGDDTMLMLFPRLRGPVTRTIPRRKQVFLRSLARAGLKALLPQINPSQADRRLFLFYLLSDQSRHLYAHYEHIDLSDIEFEMPFFDMDLLGYIVSTRTQPFLYHKLYNAWLGRFRSPAADVPWQAYPGHEPCPLPMPQSIMGQWSTDWYGGRVGAAIVDQALPAILKSRDSRVWGLMNRHVLWLLRLANRAGVRRFNYEGHFARKVFEKITGQSVFAARVKD